MDDILKDIKELSFAAGIADTFHGRDCCSALDRVEDYIRKNISAEPVGELAGYKPIPIDALKLLNNMAEQYTSEECREKDIDVKDVFEDAYNMFVRDSRKLKAMLSAAPTPALTEKVDFDSDYHKLCAQCWDALGITEYTGKHISAHIRDLVNACEKAAGIFRDYERIHLSKNPPDRAKAERNGEYAFMMEQANTGRLR